VLKERREASKHTSMAWVGDGKSRRRKGALIEGEGADWGRKLPEKTWNSASGGGPGGKETGCRRIKKSERDMGNFSRAGKQPQPWFWWFWGGGGGGGVGGVGGGGAGGAFVFDEVGDCSGLFWRVFRRC